MWKSLPWYSAWAMPAAKLRPGHLLVPDLGVEADELGALERVDEGERVAEGRQQDVAAGLVGLRLDREADVVALVGDVVAEQVHGLAVALERRADVLGRVVLGALAAAPHDEGLGAELGTEVELAEDLAQREAAHLTVVRREAAVLEDRCGEEVGGHHRDDQAGVGERALEAIDLGLALGIRGSEGEQVVVVEGQTVGAELGELLDGVHDVEGVPRRDRRTGRCRCSRWSRDRTRTCRSVVGVGMTLLIRR